MSFFRKWSESELAVFAIFSRKRQDRVVSNFFQGLGENTYLLQLALKNTALGQSFVCFSNCAQFCEVRI